MEGINVYATIGLLIKTFGMVVLAFYIIPKQFAENMRPKNQFTKLRRILLIIFILSFITGMPSLTYQYIRALGGEHVALRNFVSITGNVSYFSQTVLLLLVYTYKVKR